MKKNLNDKVKTPCIGVCSTGIGDSVCRGCKRFAHEVINWNRYTESERRIIDQRLDDFLTRVVESKWWVRDRDLLQWHLDTKRINYSQQKSPVLWVYTLLRAGASQLVDLDQYGVTLFSQYQQMDLLSLKNQIDTEFFNLSEAHYQRYFEIETLESSIKRE